MRDPRLGYVSFRKCTFDWENRSFAMFLTNVLLKKVKSRFVMVQMESLVSGHTVNSVRERLGDKKEMLRFDPYIQRESLYKEKKKVRSIK